MLIIPEYDVIFEKFELFNRIEVFLFRIVNSNNEA